MMSGLQFYVIDTETTGLKANYHELTEIGIIRYTDRKLLWRNIRCRYPERANFDALAITNKTLLDLQQGYEAEEVVSQCEKFFNEDGLTPAHRCIICHNVAFDRKFLHAFWQQQGKVFPANLWLDTLSLMKEYVKKAGLIKPKLNLQASCELLGIKKSAGIHNAKSDSKNTYLLHQALIQEHKIDYLPLIKTAVHSFEEEERLGIESLDL